MKIKIKQLKTEHFRMLQERSMRARINRHFTVEFQLLPGAKLPWRKRQTDVGFDLFASENAKLESGAIEYVHTGVCMMPPDGYFCYIAPRSGVTRNGVIALMGIIDATYTGEILVPLLNTTSTTYIIQQGDRIAQIIFGPILHPQFENVIEFSVNGKDHRGPKGFGSSGR